jgi:hypothetical protein
MRDRDMGDFGRSMVPRCDATSSQQQADLAGIVKVTVTASFHHLVGMGEEAQATG